MIIHWEGGRLNKTELVKSNLQASKLTTALCPLDIRSSLFFQMLLHQVFLENGGTGVAQCSDKATGWSTEKLGFHSQHGQEMFLFAVFRLTLDPTQPPI